ncbi:MAG: hypothetical protein A4S14_05870 [Proteobacteria bacterium SG_bin9]|nr:MAG: hypothetical protein A4S14_05870 [Proteobacteria bacterium SG_bin9]
MAEEVEVRLCNLCSPRASDFLLKCVNKLKKNCGAERLWMGFIRIKLLPASAASAAIRGSERCGSSQTLCNNVVATLEFCRRYVEGTAAKHRFKIVELGVSGRSKKGLQTLQRLAACPPEQSEMQLCAQILSLPYQVLGEPTWRFARRDLSCELLEIIELGKWRHKSDLILEGSQVSMEENLIDQEFRQGIRGFA